MSIPAHDLSALGIGRFSPGPALVHGVPDVVVDPDGDGGVTGDPLHGLALDQAVALELAGELASLLARLVDEGSERHVGDHEDGLVSWPLAPRSRRRNGSTPRSRPETLVPGVSRRRRGPRGPGPRGGPDLGIGLGRQLGGHGAELVVEAQEASIVSLADETARAKRIGRAAAPAAGAGDVGQLAHRALLGLVAQFLVGLRRRHVGHRPHLVEGHVPGAQGAHQVREVPGLLRRHGYQRPCRWRSRRRSAPRSRTRPRSHPRLESLAPVDLAQQSATILAWRPPSCARRLSSRKARRSSADMVGHRRDQPMRGPRALGVHREKCRTSGEERSPAAARPTDRVSARMLGAHEVG